MRVLITGGCGFVGHHVVEHFLKNTDSEIVIFDKLTYASNGFERLRDIEAFTDERVTVYPVDLTQPITAGVAKEVGQVDVILHLAAESHVDNSITEPVPFVMSNVAAALHMLEFARDQKHLAMFVNFSTDEVYGPAPEGVNHPEYFWHRPSNPYAASKSAQEAIGIAYENTYGVPVITTHTMNVFGERQHPEKFIPMVIRSVVHGYPVTIHANKDRTQAGSRFYIHARNVGAALEHIIGLGYHGYDEFNIVGEKEVDNLTLANLIASYVGGELNYEMVDFHSSRPGHDLRYALDGTKLAETGFVLPVDFENSLRKTVEWTLNRRDWLYL